MAICLIPTAMLAGFASGTAFALQLMAAAVAVVTVQHLTTTSVPDGAQDAALWAGRAGRGGVHGARPHPASSVGDVARQQHAACSNV